MSIDPRTGTEVADTVYAAYVKTFSNPTPTFQATGFQVNPLNSVPSWPTGPAFWVQQGWPKT